MHNLFKKMLALSISLIFYNATFGMNKNNDIELYEVMFQFLEGNKTDINFIYNEVDKLNLTSSELIKNYADKVKLLEDISDINLDLQKNITQMFINFIDDRDKVNNIKLLMQNLKLKQDYSIKQIITPSEMNSAKNMINKCIKYLTRYNQILQYTENKVLSTKTKVTRCVCVIVIVSIILYLHRHFSIKNCITQNSQDLLITSYSRIRNRCADDFDFSEYTIIKFCFAVGVIVFPIIYYFIKDKYLKTSNDKVPEIENLVDFSDYCHNYLSNQLKILSQKSKTAMIDFNSDEEIV